MRSVSGAATGDHIHDLQGTGVNARYLPGIPLPASLTLTGSLDTALQQTELAILAVTSGGMRPVMQALAERAPALPLSLGVQGL